MIKCGDYSIEDLKRLIFPVVINGIYETTINYKGEFLRLTIRVESIRKDSVTVRKLSMTTNMNSVWRQIMRRDLETFVLPLDTLKKYYHLKT